MRFLALDVHDEPDAAGIVLACRLVKAISRGSFDLIAGSHARGGL
jgi:hypothetical protein